MNALKQWHRLYLVLFYVLLGVFPVIAQEGDPSLQPISLNTVGNLVEETQLHIATRININLPPDQVIRTQFSQDGRWFTTQSFSAKQIYNISDLVITVWDTMENKYALVNKAGDHSYLGMPVFSPDSQWMVISKWASFELYQTQDLSRVHTTVQYNNVNAHYDTLNINSNHTVYGFGQDTLDGNEKLIWWTEQDGETVVNEHLIAPLYLYRTSPDKRWVFLLYMEEGTSWLWDSHNPQQAPIELDMMDTPLIDVVFSPNSELVAFVYGEIVGTQIEYKTNDRAYYESNPLYIVGGSGQLWSSSDEFSTPISLGEAPISDLFFNPQSYLMAYVNAEKRGDFILPSIIHIAHDAYGIKIWNLNEGAVTYDIPVKEKLLTLDFSGDATKLFIGSCQNFIAEKGLCDSSSLGIAETASGDVKTISDLTGIQDVQYLADSGGIVLQTYRTDGDRYEVSLIQGDNAPLSLQQSAIAVISPDQTLLLLEKNGILSAYSTADGSLVGTVVEDFYNISQVIFSPDGTHIVIIGESAPQDYVGRVMRVQDEFTPQIVEAGSTPVVEFAPEQDLTPVTMALTGVAQGQKTASGPRTAECVIQPGELLYGVARTEDETWVMAYTSGESCEGPVWFEAQADDWNDLSLTPLRILTRPTTTVAASSTRRPIRNLPDYQETCDNATGSGSSPAGASPYKIFIGNDIGALESFPDDMQATSVEEIQLVLCHDTERVVLQTCNYTQNTTLTRARLDQIYTLVNYKTKRIFTQKKFNGNSPETCPEYTIAYDHDLNGVPLPEGIWKEWVLEQLTSETQVLTRSHTQGQDINARSEANTSSEILQVVQGNTPINPIARNEAGDWIVVLLPDNSKAWLFVSLLNLAPTSVIADLPVFDGLAQDTPFALK